MIDNGSHSIKAGFSGDDAPKAVFRTFIGTRLEMIDFSGNTFFLKHFKPMALCIDYITFVVGVPL